MKETLGRGESLGTLHYGILKIGEDGGGCERMGEGDGGEKQLRQEKTDAKHYAQNAW
jgi:hypothetical protein